MPVIRPAQLAGAAPLRAWLVLAALSASPCRGGAIVYVDDDAAPGGDGAGWSTALTHLQDGLAAAAAGGVAEIRVGQGTQRPDRSAAAPGGTGERSARFLLRNGVALRGGFAGVGAPDPDARDVIAFETVLDGDLSGDDGPRFQNYGDNSRHVVVGLGLDGTAVLDGVTVRGGFADLGPADDDGAGLFNLGGSGTLLQVTFRENLALGGGGGLFSGASNPGLTVVDCAFVANQGAIGGAFILGGAPSFVGCRFEANTASGSGAVAGLSCSGSTSVVQCTFTDNTASTFTSALRLQAGGVLSGSSFSGNFPVAARIEGNAVVSDCVFTDNPSTALLLAGTPSEQVYQVIRCTFTGNGGTAVFAAEEADFRDCRFEANSTSFQGAALRVDSGVTRLARCDFVSNLNTSATQGGGAISAEGQVEAMSCRFLGNHATASGGAFWGRVRSFFFDQCLFHGNVAGLEGGALVFIDPIDDIHIRGCTVAGNQAGGPGGGLRCGTNVFDLLNVQNSILWGNVDGAGSGEASQLSVPLLPQVHVDFTCVQGLTGGLGGQGNVGDDPAFADPAGADRIAGTDDDDLRLLPGSPVTDRGDNGAVPPCLFDLDGHARMADDPATPDRGLGTPPLVDMGAYELYGAAGSDCDGDGMDDACQVETGASPDCNGNALPDACDLDSGASPDCDGNGVPDECEVAGFDCNRNGVPDGCDLAGGSSADCNGNLLPDECDLAGGSSQDCDGDGVPDECGPDCNGNGRADSCDVADGTSPDFDGDGLPDECEEDCNGNGLPDFIDLGLGLSPDCNGNGVPDECDVARGASLDCNGNLVPDECDIDEGRAPDCNGNGVVDACDIEGGSSPDLDGSGVPDECEGDCNGNGLPDFIDILFGLSQDCDGGGVPDECEDDCNRNGLEDGCDIASGASPDCNLNGVPDECDLADGSSPDCNRNNVPDDCDMQVAISAATGPLSPVLAAVPLTVVLDLAPAVTDPHFDFTAYADLGSTAERIDVLINGTLVGAVFASGASDCPAIPNLGQLVVPASTFNPLLGGDGTTVTLQPSSSVDSTCSPTSFVTMAVGYLGLDPSADADGNGVLDACECPADVNADGFVDVQDLVEVILHWGPCAPGACPGDVDGGGQVDVEDLVEVVLAWGAC
jgi:hypothetical protein